VDEGTGERRPELGEGADEGLQQRSPEEIRHDIDETRGELGETVEALAEKADFKGQAQQKVKEVKQTAQQKVEEVKQTAQQKREEFAGKVKAASPETATAGAQRLAARARENPVPLAIAGALITGYLVGRRRGGSRG